MSPKDAPGLSHLTSQVQTHGHSHRRLGTMDTAGERPPKDGQGDTKDRRTTPPTPPRSRSERATTRHRSSSRDRKKERDLSFLDQGDSRNDVLANLRKRTDPVRARQGRDSQYYPQYPERERLGSPSPFLDDVREREYAPLRGKINSAATVAKESSSANPPPPPAPIIIHNQIYNDRESPYGSEDNRAVKRAARRRADSPSHGNYYPRRNDRERERAEFAREREALRGSVKDRDTERRRELLNDSIRGRSQPYHPTSGGARRKNSSRSRQSERPRSRSPDSRDIQGREVVAAAEPEPTIVVVDPSYPRDMTVHMSLPIKDDTEDSLEEGSKLQRLGFFTEALHIFKELYEAAPGNRYIQVQYGQCLIEAGSLASFDTFAEEVEKAPSLDNALEIDWYMLLLGAGIDLLGMKSLDPSYIHGRAMGHLQNAWPFLNSTQVGGP